MQGRVTLTLNYMHILLEPRTKEVLNDSFPSNVPHPDQHPPRLHVPTHPRHDQQLPAFSEQTQQTNSPSRPPIQSQYGANRQCTMPSPYHNDQLAPAYDPEQGDFDPARVGRKKSLVRPDREKIEPGYRQWHYRSYVAQAEDEGMGRVGVMASSAFHISVYSREKN
jgi:chitin synthase